MGANMKWDINTLSKLTLHQKQGPILFVSSDQSNLSYNRSTKSIS